MKTLGLALLMAISLAGAQPALRMDKLGDALRPLSPQASRAVEQAIQLIQKGEHAPALVRLSELNRGNPDNSSLRILTAYAMLQLGNLVGAFKEAEKAHKAPNGNAYKCWFLARIALLNGRKSVCERELRHVKESGDLQEEARLLEEELRRK